MRSDQPVPAKCPRAGPTARGFAAGLMTCAALLVHSTYSADVAATVVASHAWIRWLPANLPAAGYVTLRNDGGRPVTLIGASSADYGAAMFHESRNQQGVEQMLPMDRIRIAPHSQVSFAPEGLHIMLMDPAKAIQPGDHVLIRLRFADGSSLQIQFEVRRPDGTAVKGAAVPGG
jgi:periplasmic copper chaperone A